MEKIIKNLAKIGRVHLKLCAILWVIIFGAAILGFPLVYIVENFGIHPQTYWVEYTKIWDLLSIPAILALIPYCILSQYYIELSAVSQTAVSGFCLLFIAGVLVYKLVKKVIGKNLFV